MSSVRREDDDGFTRRDFLALGAAVSAGVLGGSLLACTGPRPGPEARSRALDAALRSRIDYTRAKPVPTVCFGCTTHCGVIGWIQDGRVRLVEGNPRDPNTQGTICSKANGIVSATQQPERLLYPMKRVGPRGGGRWKRISWDEALDEVADRMRPLRENGTPERFVFHYGRDKTKGFSKRFTDAFGTPHRLNRRSICSSNRRAPLMSFYGRDFEWESQDLERTKFVLNFGGNPMEAYQGGLFMRKRMMDAKVDRGAKIVTFEVRPTATTSISDEYHAVRPRLGRRDRLRDGTRDRGRRARGSLVLGALVDLGLGRDDDRHRRIHARVRRARERRAGRDDPTTGDRVRPSGTGLLHDVESRFGEALQRSPGRPRDSDARRPRRERRQARWLLPFEPARLEGPLRAGRSAGPRPAGPASLEAGALEAGHPRVRRAPGRSPRAGPQIPLRLAEPILR